MISFQKGKIGDIYEKLRGVEITAQRMREIASDKGNVRIFSGGETIVDAQEEDLQGLCVYRVPAVIVQAFGVINVQYVETPFTFRSSFWAYTHERKELVTWLYFFLESRLELLRWKGSVHMIPKINPRDIDTIEISIPYDVKERADKLRQVKSAIAADCNIAHRIKQITTTYEAVRESIFARLENNISDSSKR